jgi:hypothetical protein
MTRQQNRSAKSHSEHSSQHQQSIKSAKQRQWSLQRLIAKQANAATTTRKPQRDILAKKLNQHLILLGKDQERLRP